MTERERDQPASPVVDESSYGASGSEAGDQYTEDGPTIANAQGDTMAADDLEDDEAATGG
jgi:hypothetical protein